MIFNLTDYKLLSFDIYATLIDWETGIYNALQPLVQRLPKDSPFRAVSPTETRRLVLRTYSAHEAAIQMEQPKLLYTDILAEIYKRLAQELSLKYSASEPHTFSSSIGIWPAYPDTVEAMKILGKYYKLVVLSNVDKASFSCTLSGPLNGVHFDAIYTAEDIGHTSPT